MRKEKITVEGMTCDHCTMAVETAVGNLDGVEKVVANFKKNSAGVKYDETKVTMEEISKAITEAGYKVV